MNAVIGGRLRPQVDPPPNPLLKEGDMFSVPREGGGCFMWNTVIPCVRYAPRPLTLREGDGLRRFTFAKDHSRCFLASAS